MAVVICDMYSDLNRFKTKSFPGIKISSLYFDFRKFDKSQPGRFWVRILGYCDTALCLAE